ncbi:MAG: DUF5681 domain-containing protein [Rhizomicrobium sp.]|jgi:hypothetical protein
MTPKLKTPKRLPTGKPFAKGRSGNPKGRPKGSKNLAGILKEALEATVTEDGARITKLEATVKKIADSAASGDPRMIQMLLAELRRLQPVDAEHDCMAVVRTQMESAKEELLAKLKKLRGQMGHPEIPDSGAH